MEIIKQISLAIIISAYSLLFSQESIPSNKANPIKRLPIKQICLSEKEGVSFKYDLDGDKNLEQISYGDASSSLRIIDNNKEKGMVVSNFEDICIYREGNISFITGGEINKNNFNKMTYLLWNGENIYLLKAVEDHLTDESHIEENRGRYLEGQKTTIDFLFFN